MNEANRPIQLHFEVPSQPVLKVERHGEVHNFYKDELIFPLRSRRGVLQNSIRARDTGKPKRRSTVYESLNDAELYLNDRYWNLSEGFEFTVK